MARVHAQPEQGTRQSAPASAPTEQVSEHEVPEVPVLAPGVTVSGEMQDHAFAQQQWLAERDGQFIQLTELLYRVLAEIDGHRSLQQIADQVSDETDLRVTADHVRQLLSLKLIPKGLVRKADGSVVAPPAGSRSPLQIRMRTKVVSPQALNPLTRVFQYLFLSPIVCTVLLATGAVAEWLYFTHGIAVGIHRVLYEPGLMLLLLGMIIVGTAFHELGHASALRYGGGQVRGMGVGLYLVYPAFYTDVTDNYRLNRRARVRTDLGGFYFNLIFALAMVGLWKLTGAEFFLLVAFLTHLEIIHQTLPFVRLDGYWALADLTGIPDFFSQIGPFLRSVLPIRGWQGSKLPDLKLWVKVVFGVYIALTVPILLLFMFLMVKGVPRVLATAFDSLSRQAAVLSASYAAGNVLQMVWTGVQMLILGLPTLGLLYVLYTLVRRIVGSLWKWSKPSAARRAIAVLVAGILAAFVGSLWAPQLSAFGLIPGASNADSPFQPIANHERWTVEDIARSTWSRWTKPSYIAHSRNARTGIVTPTRAVTSPTRHARAVVARTPRVRTTPTVGIRSTPLAGGAATSSTSATATPAPSPQPTAARVTQRAATAPTATSVQHPSPQVTKPPATEPPATSADTSSTDQSTDSSTDESTDTSAEPTPVPSDSTQASTGTTSVNTGQSPADVPTTTTSGP